MAVERLETAELGRYVEMAQRLSTSVNSVIRGKELAVEQLIAAFLAGGHVILEDVPGVGKTTLAQALAQSLDLSFQRIQFTSDTLPSDIIGISVYRQGRSEFEFIPGPLFANVVLADEINRATPRTQSALLEAMAERTVTVEKQQYELSEPFLVVATQNPVESNGTFPLPESQMDRFLMRLCLGYPSREQERSLITAGGAEKDLERVGAVLGRQQVRDLQEMVSRVHVAPRLTDYVLDVVTATRESPELDLGVSTRGAISWQRAAQALALVRGREYVLPDDLQEVAEPVLAHRIVPAGSELDPTLNIGAAERAAVRAILQRVAVPR